MLVAVVIVLCSRSVFKSVVIDGRFCCFDVVFAAVGFAIVGMINFCWRRFFRVLVVVSISEYTAADW